MVTVTITSMFTARRATTTSTLPSKAVRSSVEGASVFVQIQGVLVLATRLHVHGQTGNDNLKAADGTENQINITLEGDAGDDCLSVRTRF